MEISIFEGKDIHEVENKFNNSFASGYQGGPKAHNIIKVEYSLVSIDKIIMTVFYE